MDGIKDIYRGFRQEGDTGPTSARHEMIGKFVDRVLDKNGEKYRAGFLATKLAHVKTDELDYLYKECDKARNFSALFWYLIKAK